MKRSERSAEDSSALLEKELLTGPLQNKGFTDELRRRIERKIDRQPKLARPWLQLAGSMCFGILLLAAGFSYQWLRPPEKLAAPPARQAPTAASPAAEVPAAHLVTVRSGLLIGLRADDKATGTSSYRTLYIAPKDGNIREIAEGQGILVPYKREFWKIEPMTMDKPNGKETRLVAYPAELKPPIGANRSLTKAAAPVQTEKLMFAGNEYVSIADTEQPSTGRSLSGVSDVWVSRIPLLTDDRRGDASNAGHYTIADTIRAEASARQPGAASESAELAPPGASAADWTLIRRAGRWVPQIAEPPASGDNTGVVLHDLNLPLPESVVNYDALCCSWQEISFKQHRAVDAFSSPNNDMLAIVTNDYKLLVYTVDEKEGIADQPSLSIGLNNGESVVMAQWATEQYVNDWAIRTKRYLEPF